MNFKLVFFVVFCFFTVIPVLAERLTDLSVDQVEDMQKNTDALIIDVRTPKEWQMTGIIPGSHKLEFFNHKGQYNEKLWLTQMQKMRSSTHQPVILVCRSGNRSGLVGNYLAKQLDMKNIYHLSAGIQSWIKAGKPVAKNCNHRVCR